VRSKFVHFILYFNHHYLQLSRIVECISTVRQQLPTILYSRKLKRSSKWTRVNHYNGVTCMPIVYTTSLVSYIGLPISTVDRRKARTSPFGYYFLTRTHLHHDRDIGLGLHLKELAQQLPAQFDLHQPDRLLSSLTEYEHLHRIFRLCHVHISRNIKSCNVPEGVKNKMRSLVCMEHPNFEGTLCDIERDGGKAGSGE
jgi:hypothetical protein